MKALTLHKTEGDFKPGSCWHPIKLEDVPVPTPQQGELILYSTRSTELIANTSR